MASGQYLVMVNEAAVNIHICMYVCLLVAEAPIPIGNKPRKGIAGSQLLIAISRSV